MDAGEEICVGREEELEQWEAVLADPTGQAVLVVGQAGMGKTTLLDQMARYAEDHEEYRCGSVRHELTPEDATHDILGLILRQAYEAAKLEPGSFSGTPERREQWRAFLNIFGIGDLWMSLRSEAPAHIREQFIGTLQRVSQKLPEEGRALFVFDPEKYMPDDSDQAGRLVIRDLPPKIKLVFAQRPEDALASSDVLGDVDNVVQIPDEGLRSLTESDVEELARQRLSEVNVTVEEAVDAIQSYEGHPYAVDAALGLLADGMDPGELPRDPTPPNIARSQWIQICRKDNEAALSLLEAAAVLDVPVPESLLLKVAGVERHSWQSVNADPFIGNLLRQEAEGWRIYHSLLSDHILEELGEEGAQPYQERAVEAYRERLQGEGRPDGLAASRLPEHVLAVEGREAFIQCFTDECETLLHRLGLLDRQIDLSKRGLEYAEDMSVEKEALLSHLGLVYRTRGEMEKAESMHWRALMIDKELGRKKGMAKNYSNLGIVHRVRGKLDEAEKMHQKALDQYKEEDMTNQDSLLALIYGNLGNVYLARKDLGKAEDMYWEALQILEDMGHKEGMANQYGNLGLIYRHRGELEKAKEIHKKALRINKKLKRKKEMANQYGNLALVYEALNRQRLARCLYQQAIEVYQQVGMPHMVEKVQGWLNDLPDEE